MENGKFSQTRPNRDEERQIEETFRQLTEEGKKKPSPIRREPVIPEPEIVEDVLAELETPAEEPAAPAFEMDVPVIPEEEFRLPEEIPARPIPEILPEEPEEEFELPVSPLESLMDFCNTHRKWILIGLCAAALVLLVAVIGIFVSGSSAPAEDVILENVYIADIPVGGMTREEAVTKVSNATNQTYSQKDMLVELAGVQLYLSPQDTGASLDVNAAVSAAWDYGRTGTKAQQEQIRKDSKHTDHIIGLLPYLQLDTDYIHSILTAYAADSGSALTQATYGLEGRYPVLNTEDFDEDSAQTLVLTLGTPGIRFDVDSVYEEILDAYSLHQFRVTADSSEPAIQPDPVDLVAIYEEFYVAPVNDRMDLQSFEIIPGSYGYEFDMAAAQKLIDAAQPGETVRIPMQFIAPEQLEEDTLSRDVLGEYQTLLSGDKDRTTNIRLACAAIDGKVIQPGDSFSFNDTVGKPKSSKGYKTVTETIGNTEEEILGGGISQAAGTLYNSVLLADLEIIRRSAHQYPVDYLDYGLDAYVSYGGADLSFRNNTNYPITIEAGVSGSYVSVRLLGTDKRDYYVKMEYEITATHKPDTIYEILPHDNAEGHLDGDILEKGITGYSVKTYKLKYGKTTGALKSRDYETSTRYASSDRVIARVEEPPTTVPPTVETVPPTTAPPETQPPVTQPPETEPPMTESPATVPTEIPEATEPEAVTEPSPEPAPVIETQPLTVSEPETESTAAA